MGDGGLEATYDDHLRLTGKRVVDFLLVVTELFSPDVTAEALRANTGSKSAISLQRGLVDPKLVSTSLVNSVAYESKTNQYAFVIDYTFEIINDE